MYEFKITRLRNFTNEDRNLILIDPDRRVAFGPDSFLARKINSLLTCNKNIHNSDLIEDTFDNFSNERN